MCLNISSIRSYLWSYSFVIDVVYMQIFCATQFEGTDWCLICLSHVFIAYLILKIGFIQLYENYLKVSYSQ